MSVNSSDSQAMIKQLPWINVAAYILNAGVTYGVGIGLVGRVPSNAALSAKYQTLVTPAGWAFSIWGIIFLSQLSWVLHPVFVPAERSNSSIASVGLNYLWICIAQAAWTIAFTHEQIQLSLVAMGAVWYFLFNTISKLVHSDEEPATKAYAFWKFPFTLHFGWITAALALNLNVLLVSMHATANTQLIAAVASLIGLTAVSVFFLVHDFWIPSAAAWALFGIYFELNKPKILIATTFASSKIHLVQTLDLMALTAIVVLIVAKATEYMHLHTSGRTTSEGGTYLRVSDS